MINNFRFTVEQKEAISEIDCNLQIIACAGSGKTEVITHRIANILQSKSEVTPENIVAFTFTVKAADSMKERIAKALGEINAEQKIDGMYIGTIHGFCYQLLNRYTEKFRENKILDTVTSRLFVMRYYAECGMRDLGLDLYPRNVNLFLQCIDKMIDDYENADQWTQEQRDVLKKYMDCLYGHGYMDFSLMIFETLRQIDKSPEVAQYLSTIKYLVVDEYQDVNDLQEKLILRIAQAGANVCVVGDDDQTIYQFRGSNANNMISFPERYHDVHQVRLEKNFRCAPAIVDIADQVIANNKRRITKKMISGVPELSADVAVIGYENQRVQFDSIATCIVKLHEAGIPYNVIAVLVRKGKRIAPIAAAFDRAGIPYEADCAEHFFSGNYFNRFVITIQILSEVDKPKLYACWCDILDENNFDIGFKYLRSCARGGNQRLSEVIRGFCERTGFLDENAEDIEDRRTDLDGISKILDDYDEIYRDWQVSARIKGVLRFLGTQAAEEYKSYCFKQKDPNIDAVQLMTVHKAKGLEFHTVFLPELTKREFPVSNMGGKKYWHVLGGTFEANKDKYQSDLEDERKLFYVAVTRAKQNLYMSYGSDQQVSCFVEEAARSHYLKVDGFMPVDSHKAKVAESYPTRDAQIDHNADYWATVKYAQKELCDYYEAGAQFSPDMHSTLSEMKKWSPERILSEASKIGLL